MKKKEDTNKKKISEILNEVNESMAGEEKVYDIAGDKTLYNENEAEGVDEAEQALKTDVSNSDVSISKPCSFAKSAVISGGNP